MLIRLWARWGMCFCLLLVAGASVKARGQDLGQDPKLQTLPQQSLETVKVLLAQEKAWNRGDLDAFAVGYKHSPETIFISRTFSRGYDEMLASYHKSYPTRASMGTLTYSDLEPHAMGPEHALLVGRYHLDRSKKDGGNADGIFSLLFEKTAEGWKIILDHTT